MDVYDKVLKFPDFLCLWEPILRGQHLSSLFQKLSHFSGIIICNSQWAPRNIFQTTFLQLPCNVNANFQQAAFSLQFFRLPLWHHLIWYTQLPWYIFSVECKNRTTFLAGCWFCWPTINRCASIVEIENKNLQNNIYYIKN